MAQLPQDYAGTGQQSPAYWGTPEGQAKLRAGGADDAQIAKAKTAADAYLAQYPGAPTSWSAGPADAYAASQTQGNAAAGAASAANAAPGMPNAPAPPAIPGGAPTPSNYLEDLWKQYGGAFFGQTNQGAALPGLQQQLAAPSSAEQFYTRALSTDSDPYYQRLQKQGEDSLNQQMAARGHFNSGAAIAGLGNFTSGLKAAEYHDLGTYAAAADTGRNARIGLSGQLGAAADATDTTRLTAGFAAAGSAENLNQAAVGQFLQAQTGLDTATQKTIMDAFGKGGDLSSEAGRSAIEAEVRARISQAGGSQAQQDAAIKAVEALVAAL